MTPIPRIVRADDAWPVPGSDEAIQHGCICQGSAAVKPDPERWYVRLDCLVHGDMPARRPRTTETA